MKLNPFDPRQARRALSDLERRVQRQRAAEAARLAREAAELRRVGLAALRAEAAAGDEEAARALRGIEAGELREEVGRLRRALAGGSARDTAFAAASLRATRRRIDELQRVADAARSRDEAGRSRHERDAVAMVDAWIGAGADELLERASRRAVVGER